MKKSILKLAAITFILGAILTSCNTPAEKVEKAEANVTEAKKDLNEAQEEYLTDIENCRRATDEKIAANDQSISEFKTRIANEKKEAKADYKKKLAQLEQKNKNMKKKIDDYRADGKENWALFKADFNKGMDEIGQSLKDLTANHTTN
ncbi:MAG TPA: hypothetical protein VF411_05270 [Bacteroidia bacterium]